jgi:sugar diacid utilization regulator
MASELQAIVDALGKRLKRAVAVDDPRLRLLAYSSHHGSVDQVRLASILHREAPDEPRRWVFSLGVADADEPLRIPGNPELGMDARVCAPVRYQGQLLGYLWLIDADETLTEDELVAAGSAAEAAAAVMYRERLQHELERGRERELLRDLMSEDVEVRQQAADELVAEGLFVSGSPVAVLVTRAVREPNGEADEEGQMAISLALEHARRMASPRHSLQLVRPGHGLFVVATKDPALRPRGLHGVGEELRDELQRSLHDGWRVYVGIGDTQSSLCYTAHSHRQAQQAVRVAGIVRSLGPIAAWAHLGIYQMLSQFPVEKLASDALHPGLVRLFEHKDAVLLVRTLEHYLDRAGDAKTTAAELDLHRASLYYRLHRIEEISNTSLRDGDDRLALHLGLKLARLAGIHPVAQSNADGDPPAGEAESP